MTDHDSDNLEPTSPQDYDEGAGDQPMPIETPRRAASAEFVVDTEVGSGAALRDAMDPANQSLADALRLSYRVLQVVILILVVLFMFSGLKSVPNDQTGVLTVWGKITRVLGSTDESSGFQFSAWPYPAAEFILFPEENRTVELGLSFWPRYNGTFAEAVGAAGSNDQLRPGRDGSIITRDAELAHLQMSATYAVRDPEEFVTSINTMDDTADRIVRLALRQATVQIGARLNVEDISDGNDALAAEIRRAAQQQLDRIQCGLILQTVHVPRTSPPLAVRNTMADLQQASVQVAEMLEQAHQDATQELTSVAGRNYREIIDLINNYEQALDSSDEAGVERLQASINDWLDRDTATGEVASTIQRAHGKQAQVELTLGIARRRFESYLPQFRKDPESVIQKLWLQARATVLGAADVEIFYTPLDFAGLHIQIDGLDNIAALRRKNQLRRSETESLMQFRVPGNVSTLTASDYKDNNKGGRTLKVKDGKVVGRENN